MSTMQKSSIGRPTNQISRVSSLRNSANQAKIQTPIGRVDEKRRSLLLRRDSNQSVDSTHMEKYDIHKVETRTSMLSSLSVQSQYKVTLQFNDKEIALLRYTWEQMLMERPSGPESANSFFPTPNSLWNEAKENSSHHVSSSRRNYGVKSNFCSQLYSNLLAMDPELEQAFPSLKHQAASMAGVLSLAINSLENLSSLDGYLLGLGNRHSRILGIEASQFELMGEAFILTFHERFGTRFTHELEILWIEFYMYLANTLLQFGIDPVMRCEASPQDHNELANMYSTLELQESKHSSSMTSVVDRTEPSTRRSTPVLPITPTSASTRPPKGARTKIRNRFSRAKEDCTIV